MKIEYRSGNLFDGSDVRFLVHCCNMKQVMGAGFAKELRVRYPGAYDVYVAEPQLSLGQIIPYEASDGRTIFNLIGQRSTGSDGRRYVSYDALVNGFETLDGIAKDIGMGVLFMPALGSALAGGSWSIIEQIIETHCTNMQPVVYLLDGKRPN